MARKSNWALGLLFSILALSSCDKKLVLDENQQVKNYRWSYEDAKSFTAAINDTSITYNIYINVRHSFQFEWRNVWVNIETVFPDGHSFNKRVNLLLSEPDGHWYAKCLGDNCDIQIPIQQNAYFPQPGNYTFKITQDMRVDPLPHFKSIGIRIEKDIAD